MSKGKFALGAVIGAVAGVVAGFLTAPRSGKETRADLKKKADELKAEAASKGEELKKKGEATYKDTKDVAKDLQSRSERAFNSAKAEFKKDDAKR